MKRLRQLLAAPRELPRALIHLPVVFTLTLGLLVTATMFMAIRTFEQDRIQADFNQRAGNREIAVKQGLADSVDALATVNRLFMTMQPVTRAQFATFVAPILKRSPQLRLIAYQRLVGGRERAAFEAERGADTPGFAITTLADGKLVKAPSRAQYRVVDYLAPTEGNEAAFGLDAASRSEQDAAIRRSCETGEATITSQYGVMLANRLHPGFLLLMPVYRAGAALDPRGSNCALVTGYTAVAISSATLIEKTLAPRGLLGKGEFDIRVYAEDAGKQPNLVFQARGGQRAASPLAALFAGPARHARASFEVAGRQWQIAIDAGRGRTGRPASVRC
jgi:CHASE1-domain containing sensor protein